MHTLKKEKGTVLPKTNYWNGIFCKRCLLLVTLLLSVLVSDSQEITLDFTNAPLPKVLTEIKEQSKFEVFYNQALLRGIKPVTIKADKEPLQKLLARLFESLPVNYSIANNTIVITPKIVSKPETNNLSGILPFPGNAEEVIRGRVVDYKNKPLEGIMVQYDQSYFFTTTNAQGDFSIPGGRGTIINFSGAGYTEMEARYNGEGFVLIQMEPMESNLQGVMVSSVAGRKDPTTHIDLTNRSYMNLSQILQGTIPGVSLQTVVTTSTVVTSIESYNPRTLWTSQTLEQFLRSNPARGQAIIDALLTKNYPSWMNQYIYRLHYTTKTATTMVPELRGVNSFAGNANGMLVVIDGFPKDGFPADFPMNNVESVEVIKDPKELLKWGPRANGGVILIRTKQGKMGELQVNYAANLYYSPAPQFNRNKLQLPNTTDVLDYMLQADSMFNINAVNPATNFNATPAAYILSKWHGGALTTDQFHQQWDSLGKLNNESQVKLLQQNAFTHNHNLSVNGGNRNYKFSIIGGYTSTEDNGLNGYNRAVNLNMNHSLNLLKDKLNVNLLVYGTSSSARAGYSINTSSLTLQPYQMLLDNNGQYVYDYSTLNSDANAVMMKAGYYNHGVNLLEDSRVNKLMTKTFQGQSRLNWNWKLLPGIQWNASLYYSRQSNGYDNFYDKRSSYARQIANQYGEYSGAGVTFYVPYGNIMQRTKSINNEWNVRTGLDFTRSFGKSEVSLSIGGGAASVSYRQPATAVMYGYNTETETGAPIFLPTPDPKASISNFYKLFSGQTSTSYPYNLTTAISLLNTNSRNVNWNAGVTYKYDKRLSLSATYNSVYNPVSSGQVYSKMSNYFADGTLDLFRHPITKWVDNVSVSTGISGTQMPDLPVAYSASRYQQVYWSNYAVWVNSYAPTQQLGQKSQNVYQALKLTLFKGRYEIRAAYNSQSMRGISLATTTEAGKATSSSVNTVTNIGYVSAGVKGNLRNGALVTEVNYSKSPEGESQVNGAARYNLAKESFFHSKVISSLEFDAMLENVSPFQGMGLMMGTNVSSGGSYSMATNSTFSSLPPKNVNYEARGHIGFAADRYLFDLRYYNRTTSGLNNSISVAADASSGLSSQISYSNIVNKGVEFFLKATLIRSGKFSYAATINGAYNVNIAKQVPRVGFTATDAYALSYRDGYNTTNVWSYKWAGLDNQGNPQIYNTKGEKTAVLDSATLVSAMVYSGVLKAPWNGGFIHEINYGAFFSRIAFTFSWGAIMKRYIPTPSYYVLNSALIRDRWKKPGDELRTDVPAMALDGETSYRGYVTRNSSNSIMSADYVRLQEIMIGCKLPQSMLKYVHLKNAFCTFQVQNAAIWTKNKMKLDPATVASNGVIGMPLAKQYSFTLNVSL